MKIYLIKLNFHYEKLPLVSVIMNCYNGETYLKRRLKVFYLSLIKIGKLFFGIIYQQTIVKKLYQSLMIKE